MLIYDLTIEMDIKRKQFSVHGNISGLKAFTEYSFLIYSKTTHLSIRSKGKTIFYKTELYEKEQALPECLKIQITTKEEEKLEVDYVCQLEESHNPLNQFNNRCVELGLYCPWYPMLKTLDSAMFKIEISGLKEYTVLNAKKVGDLQMINYENQTDAYIIAFKKPYVFSYSQERMNVSII